MDDYKKLLGRINEALKQGDKTQIKNCLLENGITISVETIRKVLNGDSNSKHENQIIQAALSIIEKRKEQQKIKSDALLAKMKAVGLVF